MIINSLEQMENIVSSKSDLSWDGWNVVRHTESSNGMYSVCGEFKDGRWTKKKVFPLKENGWIISNITEADYAQLEK